MSQKLVSLYTEKYEASAADGMDANLTGVACLERLQHVRAQLTDLRPLVIELGNNKSSAAALSSAINDAKAASMVLPNGLVTIVIDRLLWAAFDVRDRNEIFGWLQKKHDHPDMRSMRLVSGQWEISRLSSRSKP